METFWNFGGNLNVLQINAGISEPKMVECPNCKALLTYKEGRGYVTNLILLDRMDQNLQGTFVQSGLCLFPPLPAVCPNDPPLCLANASPYWMPEPILSGSSSLKKNWMQLIPIEMTSSTSLYAEKYFGETFKKLSKQLLSFRFRTLFRSWQGLFWSTWERPLPHFRLSLHSFQGKWGRFPGRTCQRNILIV